MLHARPWLTSLLAVAGTSSSAATCSNEGLSENPAECNKLSASMLQQKAFGKKIALESNQEAMQLQDCVPKGMQVITTASGFKMVVLGHDIVSNDLKNRGYWEIRNPEDMAPHAFRQTFPKSGTLLDIGANIGDYTMLFASKGYHVIAVEPMTRNRLAMQGTLCLNPHFKDRVKIVSAALVSPGELAGQKCIIQSTNYNINIGNGALRCGHDKTCKVGDSNCEEVPVKTLSMILADLNATAIDVMKMDVEGYECQILEGGEEVFAKYNPKVVQVETNVGNSAQCVGAMARKYSYETVTTGANTAMVSQRRMFLVQTSDATLGTPA